MHCEGYGKSLGSLGLVAGVAALVKNSQNTYKIEVCPFEEFAMSAPAPHAAPAHEVDGVEAIVPLMPIVLPVMGAVLMLLLAFIAVFMA